MHAKRTVYYSSVYGKINESSLKCSIRKYPINQYFSFNLYSIIEKFDFILIRFEKNINVNYFTKINGLADFYFLYNNNKLHISFLLRNMKLFSFR